MKLSAALLLSFVSLGLVGAYRDDGYGLYERDAYAYAEPEAYGYDSDLYAREADLEDFERGSHARDVLHRRTHPP